MPVSNKMIAGFLFLDVEGEGRERETAVPERTAASCGNKNTPKENN